jgi:polyhydroxyalkanoate synthesis regulator phasin
MAQTSLEKLFEESIRGAFDAIVKEELTKAVESVKTRLSEKAEFLAHQIKGVYEIQHDKEGIRIAVSKQFSSDTRTIEELREQVNILENKLLRYNSKF